MMFARFMINLFGEVLRMKTFLIIDNRLSKLKQKMLSEKTSIFSKEFNRHLQLYV